MRWSLLCALVTVSWARVVPEESEQVINNGSNLITKDAKVINNGISRITEDSKVINNGISRMTEDSKVTNNRAKWITEESRQMIDSGTNRIPEDSKLIYNGSHWIQESSKHVDSGFEKVLEDYNLINNRPNQISEDSGQLMNCFVASSFLTCLKMNALLLLEDFTSKSSPIPILGSSVTLVKSQANGGRMLPSLEEMSAALPADVGSREKVLSRLLFYSVGRFIRSRALQISLSDVLLGPWNTAEEGRKKNKGGGVGMAMAMAGSMMAALGLSGIAMMAGKALMVSMMALMLAALSALRGGGKGGGGHSDHAATTYEVINVPTGHHGRSLMGPRGLVGLVGAPPNLSSVDAALLAYRAHLETVGNQTHPVK